MSSSPKRALENAEEPPSKRIKIDQNPYYSSSIEDPATKPTNDDNDEWWNTKKYNNEDEEDGDQAKNEIIDYFANIDYMISNNSFESPENEQIFITNTLKEIEQFDDAVFIFEHPDISKILEKFIQILPSLKIRHFISKFVTPNLYELICKKCSSHVLQTIFALIPRILIEEQQTGTNDDSAIHSMSVVLTEIITKLQSYDADNLGLARLFIDEKSTFVLRDLLWISSGVVRFNQTQKKTRMKLHNIRKIPSLQKFSLDHIPQTVTTFASTVAQIVLQYKTQYKISTHIKHHSNKRDKHCNILCGSLQVLIECLFITKCDGVLNDLIEEILTPPPAKENAVQNETEKQRIKKHIDELIVNESASHLMQTMFEFGNKTVSLNIIKNYLNAKEIREIALDANGNYVLQSMLRRLFDVKSIQFIASSVQHHITQLFDDNKIGVLYCLINAFSRANLKPNAMVKTILKEIEKRTGNDLLDKFLYLNLNAAQTKQNLIRSKIMALSSKYSILGCLLLQSIVKCNSHWSYSVCKCFLTLDGDRVMEMCKDSSGSHVIQSFIESGNVFDEVKWEFLLKIKDRFHLLCTDKFGNYIMESTFFALPFPYKKQFAMSLLRCEAVLKGSRIGVMLHSKMKLDLLSRDPQKWREFIMTQRKHQIKNKKTKTNNEKYVKNVKTVKSKENDKKEKKSMKKPNSNNFKKKKLTNWKYKKVNKQKVKKSKKLF